MKECKKCMAMINDNARFCEFCGATVKRGIMDRFKRKEEVGIGKFNMDEEDVKDEEIKEESIKEPMQVQERKPMKETIMSELKKDNQIVDVEGLHTEVEVLNAKMEELTQKINILTNDLKWMIDNNLNWASAYLQNQTPKK